MKKLKVVHFLRYPVGGFSLERLFEDIRQNLPDDIEIETKVSKYPSRGIWRRLYNTMEASFQQGDVNHITGDVHFLNYFLNKRKTILTIADLYFLERSTGFKRFLLWFFWFYLPAKKSGIITVISEATKSKLLEYLRLPLNKIRVVYCHVSAEFIYSPKKFNSKLPCLLVVGTGKNKNIERIIEAISGIDCILTIVGKLSYSQKDLLVKKHISYQNYVNLSRAELVKRYDECDMLVFTSVYEGFGLPIVEANAVGRPVVTSNILSMPEVAGDAACLVNPFEVQSIRQGVLKIVSDSNYREQLINHGLLNAQRFQLDVITKQYSDIYREVACHHES